MISDEELDKLYRHRKYLIEPAPEIVEKLILEIRLLKDLINSYEERYDD